KISWQLSIQICIKNILPDGCLDGANTYNLTLYESLPNVNISNLSTENNTNSKLEYDSENNYEYNSEDNLQDNSKNISGYQKKQVDNSYDLHLYTWDCEQFGKYILYKTVSSKKQRNKGSKRLIALFLLMHPRVKVLIMKW
ncbi:27240_t:CDS:2, partial [Dentiscutata erythropus]